MLKAKQEAEQDFGKPRPTGKLPDSRSTQHEPRRSKSPVSSTLTKRALEQSLKRLLTTKPLSKITITDITEDCDISRMTFYYHFKDIYDLVEWSLEEDAAIVLQGTQTVETWQEGYLAVLNELKQNKAFITTIYREMSRERVERFLLPATRRLILGVIETQPNCTKATERARNFIADFYAQALAGVTLEWIEDGMACDPQTLVSNVALLLEGALDTAIERFAR